MSETHGTNFGATSEYRPSTMSVMIGELKAMIIQMEVETSGDLEDETASKQKFRRLMKSM